MLLIPLLSLYPVLLCLQTLVMLSNIYAYMLPLLHIVDLPIKISTDFESSSTRITCYLANLCIQHPWIEIWRQYWLGGRKATPGHLVVGLAREPGREGGRRWRREGWSSGVRFSLKRQFWRHSRNTQRRLTRSEHAFPAQSSRSL